MVQQAFDTTVCVQKADLKEGECTFQFALLAHKVLNDALEKQSINYYCSPYASPTMTYKNPLNKNAEIPLDTDMPEILAAHFGPTALPVPKSTRNFSWNGIEYMNPIAVDKFVKGFKSDRTSKVEPHFVGQLFDITSVEDPTIAHLMVAGLRPTKNPQLLADLIKLSNSHSIASSGISMIIQMVWSVRQAMDHSFGLYWLTNASGIIGCAYQCPPGTSLFTTYAHESAELNTCVENISLLEELDMTLDINQLAINCGFTDAQDLSKQTLRDAALSLRSREEALGKQSYTACKHDLTKIAHRLSNPGMNLSVCPPITDTFIDSIITGMCANTLPSNMTYFQASAISNDPYYDTLMSSMYCLAPVDIKGFAKKPDKNANRNEKNNKRQKVEEILHFPTEFSDCTPTLKTIGSSTSLILEIVNYSEAVKRWTAARQRDQIYNLDPPIANLLLKGSYIIGSLGQTAKLVAKYPTTKGKKPTAPPVAGGTTISGLTASNTSQQLNDV
jgi:hypothetical protein